MAVVDGIYQHLEGTQSGVSSLVIDREISFATDLNALLYRDSNNVVHIFKENPSHNLTSVLQGGTTDQYYHLTLAEYTNLGYLLSPLSPIFIQNNRLMIDIDSNYFDIVNNKLSMSELTSTIRYANSVVINDNYDLITKGYLDSIIQGASWLPSVITFFDNTTLPLSPVVGDRYIATTTANSWTIQRIYEWSGSSWTETIPVTGNMISVDDVLFSPAYQYTGSSWRSLSSVTLHNSLQGLQGGVASEYYHLSAAIYNNLINLNPTSGDIIVGGNSVPFAKISGLNFTNNTLHLPTATKITNNTVVVDDSNLVVLLDVVSFTGTNNVAIISGITSISITDSTIMGKFAGNNAAGLNRNTIYGRQSGAIATNLTYSISIGNYTNYNANSCSYLVSIGELAGQSSISCSHVINIGHYAGYGSNGVDLTINIGDDAGYTGSATGCINIGKSAGSGNSVDDMLSITNRFGTEVIGGYIGSDRKSIKFSVAEVNINQITTNVQNITASSGTLIIDCDLGSYISVQMVSGLTTIQLNNLKIGSNIQLELKQPGTALSSININAYEDVGITVYPIRRKPINQSIITNTNNVTDLLSISTGKNPSGVSVMNIVSANMVSI